jgi:hypothetical protein
VIFAIKMGTQKIIAELKMGFTTQELKATSTSNHNSDKDLGILHLELPLLPMQQILPNLH